MENARNVICEDVQRQIVGHISRICQSKFLFVNSVPLEQLAAYSSIIGAHTYDLICIDYTSGPCMSLLPRNNVFTIYLTTAVCTSAQALVHTG